MKIKPLTEKEINYDILNALNLYNEKLGEEYIKNHFNPFTISFELNEGFVVERLENGHTDKEINSPEFILGGITETKNAFNYSIANCQNALLEIEKALADPNAPESIKEELKKLKVYLLCRIQLLNINIKNIKKDKNTFKMYSELESLDFRLGELFEKSYKEEFDVILTINQFIQNVTQNSKTYKKELANAKLIQKAKDIIKQNEIMEQKQVEAQKIDENTKTDKPQEKSQVEIYQEFLKEEKSKQQSPKEDLKQTKNKANTKKYDDLDRGM